MRTAKRKFKVRSFCMLEADLIESDAFRDLTGKAAIVCLIRFHQKAHRKRTSRRHRTSLRNMVITNNGEIKFTYGEARELGIKSSNTFHRVIRELVEEKGFIDVAEPGNWYLKQPTKYSISWRWKRYGTPDYEAVQVPRQLPMGIGFKSNRGSSSEGEPPELANISDPVLKDSLKRLRNKKRCD